MAHRMLRDLEADGWERSDFPILCETCLGPNPYVRMTKEEYGMISSASVRVFQECKICGRPFTLFRWRPGAEARFKKTEICQTCSKAKNVCQTCLLDLEYNLPVQVRDHALGIDGTKQLPRSDVNKEYRMEQLDAKQAAGEDFESSYGKMRSNDLLTKLQRTTPYYKRNRARICSFFVRGECSRGAECPFRHEMPETGELSDQNMKDRYYGINDPVAEKMLKKASDMPALKPPIDPAITTLYVGGLDSRVGQQDLKDVFYGYGEIDEIRVVSHKNCAFVTYKSRSDAEKAASELDNKLVVKGLKLKLLWGRSNPTRSYGTSAPRAGYGPGIVPPMVPGMPPPFIPPQMQQHIPGVAASPYPAAIYPSMDPNSRGGRR